MIYDQPPAIIQPAKKLIKPQRELWRPSMPAIIIGFGAAAAGSGTSSPASSPPNSPSSFVPTDLGAALISWYEADTNGTNVTVTTDGSTACTNAQGCTQWNDSSGNGRHIGQGTSGQKPLWVSSGFNSKSGVTFSAASHQGLIGPPSSVGSLTTFSVFLYGKFNNATAAYGRVFSTGLVGNADSATPTQNYIPLIRKGSGAQIEAYQAGDVATETLPFDGTHQVIGSIRNGTSITTYVDGATSGAATVSAFTFGSIFWSLGGGIDASLLIDTASCSDIELKEVIVANSDVTANVANIQSYFKTRWGA